MSPKIILCTNIIILGSLMISGNNNAIAKEWLLESDLRTRVDHNDNVFLTTDQKQTSTNLSVIPKAKVVVRERNWNANLDTSIKGNYYDDSALNSNDVTVGASGNYTMERDVFSLFGSYIRDNNLNSASSDFGLAETRVKSKTAVYSPSYTRYLTERLRSTFSYQHTSITYNDAATTGFIPSSSDTFSGNVIYNLTELNDLVVMLSKTAYESSDLSTEYDLHSFRIGLNSRLSDTTTTDISVGRSFNDSILRSSNQEIVILGIRLTPPDSEQKLSNKNTVFELSISEKHELWSLSGNISKDNTTDAFGNLNEVEQVGVRTDQTVTTKTGYAVDLGYERVRSVNTITSTTDRNTLFANLSMHYNINRNWVINASYRYSKREYETLSVSERPDSNVYSVSLVYILPSISTF